ncbi:hypothetical protein SAMN02745134_03945 [Clostridium acidisoli DSM 12555]|uniref:Uncharacterized protein n=1 Tax=Clostridium acidisoli DSM 12555 TaxID=1121291 RepID=A0A1W1Y095_9CLOT|nr:hypothetical protein [Clostridium acidisoli]SMC29583.1 hypothetical protein SAMN02745134_03945 [Clostridium acidisoli DSM 12555]
MKVVAKPIEVISYTDDKGELRPIRFRLQMDDESVKVIKIDKIIVKNIEKLAGNPMFVFQCQSLIDGIQKQFEIKYELQTCKWILFKI